MALASARRGRNTNGKDRDEGVGTSEAPSPKERFESRATNSVNEFEIKGPLLRYASVIQNPFMRSIVSDLSTIRYLNVINVFLGEDTGPIAGPVW
ncbi:hypothetical protein V1478_008289 [Vespula squamosa]|uniref:Uncharacterized protein n=1 Tax=Vespula squamosa TaxID=30214 RepID=A0ABD2AZ39_VESSQ